MRPGEWSYGVCLGHLDKDWMINKNGTTKRQARVPTLSHPFSSYLCLHSPWSVVGVPK